MRSAEVIQQRKEGLVAFTFIELLILMVFAAVLFAMAIEREVELEASQLEIALRAANAKVEKLEDENRALRDDNAALRAQIEELTLRLEQYRLADGSFVDAGALKRYISNLRPACTFPDDFLFNVSLLEDGTFAIQERAWSQTSNGRATAATIPGLVALIEGATVSADALARSGQSIFDHSELPSNRCRYRVDASTAVRHSDLQLYLTQVATLQKYFYVKTPRLVGQ